MPATATQTVTAAPARITGQPSKLARKDFRSVDYWLEVENGHTPEHLKDPHWWAHYSRKLASNTIVHARWEDGTRYAQYLVIASGEGWVKVEEIVAREFDASESDPTPMQDLYKIDHVGSGWRVIGRNTAKVLADKLPKRTDAEAFIATQVALRSKQ